MCIFSQTFYTNGLCEPVFCEHTYCPEHRSFCYIQDNHIYTLRLHELVQMLIERILLLVALVTLVTLVIELSGMYSFDMSNSLGFQVKTFVTLITLERQMFEMINSDMTQH